MLRDFESERQRLFTRRSLLLGGIQAGLFGGLAARMYYLQITEGMRYATLAEENRISTQLLAPSRGLILDRFGQKLATNEQNFRLVVVPDQVGDVLAMVQKLGAFVPFEERDIKRIQRDLRRGKSFAPLVIAENLTWPQAAAIETRLPELTGVSIDVGQIRHYPYPTSTAHVLGYVAAVSENDLKLDGDPVLSIPGVQIGKSGLEKVLEKDLRGLAGAADMEVNAFGRVIREVARREGQPGHNASLTLDVELQNYMQQRLMTERSAAAVVMDVHTGEVYAFSSHPSFDGNTFTRGISQSDYTDLTSDETTPLINKVTAGLYPPGSTFKPVVALAGMASGIDSSHRVSCGGSIQLGDHRFHCWKRGGHGTLDMVGAIRESCDVYFYDLASRIGIDAIATMARRLGLGSNTKIDLPGERPGLVPDRAWKEAVRGERWQGGETLIVSIGQGDMLTTPLQLAVMISRIVNGGNKVEPHLTREIDGKPGAQTAWPSLGIDPHHLAVVTGAMNSVCNDKHGTAYNHRIKEPGKEMGGKTGTSQVRRISMAERATGVVRNEDRPWRLRDHGLFIGFAPVNAPRYACAVLVEHGGGGSKAAAPIVRDILAETQRLNPVQEGRAPIPASQFIPPTSGAGGLPGEEETD